MCCYWLQRLHSLCGWGSPVGQYPRHRTTSGDARGGHHPLLDSGRALQMPLDRCCGDTWLVCSHIVGVEMGLVDDVGELSLLARHACTIRYGTWSLCIDLLGFWGGQGGCPVARHVGHCVLYIHTTQLWQANGCCWRLLFTCRLNKHEKIVVCVATFTQLYTLVSPPTGGPMSKSSCLQEAWVGGAVQPMWEVLPHIPAHLTPPLHATPPTTTYQQCIGFTLVYDQ